MLGHVRAFSLRVKEQMRAEVANSGLRIDIRLRIELRTRVSVTHAATA